MLRSILYAVGLFFQAILELGDSDPPVNSGRPVHAFQGESSSLARDPEWHILTFLGNLAIIAILSVFLLQQWIKKKLGIAFAR